MVKSKVAVALFVFHFCVFAQDSTALRIQLGESIYTVSSEPASQKPDYGSTTVQVSANPTAQELADLFVSAGRGIYDPFKVIGSVVERKENAVGALNELLFSETITESPPNSAVMGPDSAQAIPQLSHPNKVYAVWCLRAIGTAEALSTLSQAAAGHKEINVRALSLQSLALDYHHKAQSGEFIPDKEIVHLFLRNADDVSEASELSKTIADVSREGLKNWTGRDLGNGKRTIAERELWWLENKDKLSWNVGKGQFEIK